MKGKGHLGDQGTDGRIVLLWILEKLFENVEWIHMVQDRIQ
jgi:hypothetical protein